MHGGLITLLLDWFGCCWREGNGGRQQVVVEM